ncbi:hypothetical protein ACFWAR_01110 [Streptomyces sp. NPDC059917]|uniref:hypothetical protein n=1 Tax=Streptomyces sp. NPDC059917 TaxID=3347002 RepID=UPI00366160CF
MSGSNVARHLIRPWGSASRMIPRVPQATVCVLALVLPTVCLVDESHQHQHTGTAAQSTRLASALGCREEVVTDSHEFREGACTAGERQYRVLSFAKSGDREAWLTEAQAYGGTYVVGGTWVVVTGAPEPGLKALATRLGGEVKQGATHDSGHADHDPASPE